MSSLSLGDVNVITKLPSLLGSVNTVDKAPVAPTNWTVLPLATSPVLGVPWLSFISQSYDVSVQGTLTTSFSLWSSSWILYVWLAVVERLSGTAEAVESTLTSNSSVFNVKPIPAVYVVFVAAISIVLASVLDNVTLFPLVNTIASSVPSLPFKFILVVAEGTSTV